jgi:hypothetical protein
MSDVRKQATYWTREAVAAEKLYPGQSVRYDEGRGGWVADSFLEFGVVNPFGAPVVPGGKFTVLERPGRGDPAVSEAWLRDYLSHGDSPGYDTVMYALETGSLPERYDEDWASFRWEDDYLHFNGIDAHGEIDPEFWDHVSVVLGREIPPSKRSEWWSCSC